MATYIWQNPQWPNFFWNAETISEPLSDVRLMQGLLIGRITALGFDTEMNTALNVMTDDLIKSSEIEGVMLDGKMVRSSIAWQLGLEQEGLPTQNRYLEGLVEVMIDAFWENNKGIVFNDRQRKVIGRLLDGFEGKMTTSKWSKICKCSSDTSLRDLKDLAEKGILTRNGIGKGTFYEINVNR